MKKSLLLLTFLVLGFPPLTYAQCIEGDCKNGFGVYVFADGGEYSGAFVNGKFSGQGKLVFPDGNFYEGMFEEGLLNGNGTLTYADGSIYIGEFANDKKN